MTLIKDSFENTINESVSSDYDKTLTAANIETQTNLTQEELLDIKNDQLDDIIKDFEKRKQSSKLLKYSCSMKNRKSDNQDRDMFSKENTS